MQRLALIHQNLTSNFEKLEVELLPDLQVGIIYLNSPKDLNVLTAQMRREIGRALVELDKNPQIKVLILLSKVEKAFCAGGDVKNIIPLTFETQMSHDDLEFVNQSMENLRKPLITGVHGVTFGGGFEVALFGDIIVAAEDAKFSFPEIKLGIIPGLCGTQRFTHLVGRTVASRYILTGDVMSAKEAQDLGVVNFVVKRENLREECLKVAARLTEKSVYSLIVGKQAIKQADEMPLSIGSKVERYLFNAVLSTRGAKEGLGAFVEKRKPNFKDL